MGMVRYLFRKPGKTMPMVGEETLELVDGQGIVGDKAFGSRKRQILMVDEGIIQKYALSPGDLRENIVTTGLDLPELESASLLQIGEAILEITGDCAPCDYMDNLQEGLQEQIRGERGILAVVRTGSEIHVGDPINIVRNGAK
jgi:MOSC domain-containing protein YiiM